jgi:hypothetical protein
MKLTQSTKRAIKKYGTDVLVEAYFMHIYEGEGASAISHSFPVLKGNTRAGDAAINAGRELAGK